MSDLRHGFCYIMRNEAAETLYKKVWSSWKEGMINFAKDPELKAFWDAELKHGSYYGFLLEDLKGGASTSKAPSAGQTPAKS